MSDVADYFHDSTQAARLAATVAMDEDPEQASRAVELSQTTGVPSTAIYGDVDGFERQTKVAIGSSIVNDNQYIADYLNSHPMAPRLSHDDLGQLDVASRAISGLHGPSRVGAWLKDDPVRKSFMAGFGEEPVGRALFQRPEDIDWAISHPLVASVAGAAAMPVEMMSRTIGGMVRMGHDGLESIFGKSFADDAAGMAEWAMMRGDIATAEPGPLKVMEQNAKLLDTIRETAHGLEIADPWANVGRDPPAGVHPTIDEAKKIQAKEDGDALDEALKESAKSATRERSPEFYGNFVRAHLGEREMGIDPEAIQQLYGDKVPEAGDNLLGWIPNLADRLASARVTGDDIRVPMADWLANIDPKVHKQLHDDLRLRDDGVTLNETKIEAEPKTSIAEPVAQIRAMAGLEPSFAAGDRFVELRKKPPKPEAEGMYKAEGLHDIDILDENGNAVGTINISEQKGGKQLYIDMIQAGEREKKFYQPNFLGPSLVRDIKRQLKNMFPDAETITGHRVSGAREAAGKEMEMPLPVVKLDVGDDPTHFRNLLSPYWEQMLPGVEGLRKPEGLWGQHEQELAQAVREEAAKIIPGIRVDIVHAMDAGVGRKVFGAFGTDEAGLARVIVSLEKGPLGVVGTLQHEAIHALRRMGLFNDSEWMTLERAARDGGWINKFNINRRYPDLDMPKKLEEAIAEGYRSWRKGEAILRDTGPFQKLKDFIDTLYRRFKEIIGRDFDWEELFKEVTEGKVGRREPGTVEGEAPKFAEGRGKTQLDLTPAERKHFEEMLKDPYDLLDEVPSMKLEGSKLSWDAEHTGHFLNWIDDSRAARGKGERLPPSFYNEDRLYKRMVNAPTDFKIEPKFAVGEEEGLHPLYDKGKALGVTQSHMDRMLKLIEKRNAEDEQASFRRAELRQRRRSNKEYKERRTQLRDEVSNDLGARPDIALDKLFTAQRLKLDPTFLSEDQKARLPKDYIQKKNGVNPDDLAPHFGYTSGDALVERLGILTEDRRRAGMSHRDYFNRLVDVETDRRLNQEFGDREKNILDEAKDQALSETQLNLTHEETLAYALKAGIEPEFTKEKTIELVKGVFNDTPVGQIDSYRTLAKAGAIGKKIEEASSKGDWALAYRLSQQRQFAIIGAKFAREYEKARTSFDRTAKTFRKREMPNVDAVWTNWIHDLLLRVGKPVNRSIQDLAENIGRQTYTALKDFVEAKQVEWNGMRELPVADYLMDPAFRKPVDELTFREFMGLKNSVDTLAKAGRDEKKVYREGEAWDREMAVSEMRQKLSTFGYARGKFEPGKVRQWPRAFFYGMTNMETLLNRWDRADPRGIFNRLIMYPLADAANGKARLQREIAKAYDAIPKPKDITKLVDAPFPDPMSRKPELPEGEGPWPEFRRSHVLAMLQHAGNQSNWKVLAHGYGADPIELWHWLVKNTTKEDWDRQQKFGDTIFTRLVKMSDLVYERMTGATIEKVPIEPFEITHPDGTTSQYKGWYHPLEADPARKTVWVQDPETGQWSQQAQGRKASFDDMDFHHFTTANGYTKKRTGAIYPLDLNYDAVPTTIKQMIHDISFREVLHETQKIFGDRRFEEDVRKYYGTEYADGLMPYLRSVAGAEGVPGRQLAQARKASEFFRQNVISTYIGLNPYTMLKHGPTALVMSARESGAWPLAKAMAKTLPYDIPFVNAVHTLFGQSTWTSKATHEFLMENFEEVARRERHWQDTIAGQGREITGAGNWREKIIEKGSAGVAWSDLISAKSVALATYNKYIADGLSHGESITLANRAVRRAHGSTAETNLVPAMRGGGDILHPWLTSVYGFFGTAMQRRIETMHKLNDAWQLGREKEIAAASKKMASAFGDFMTYMIWPTIVEEIVQGIGTDDHRTWGTKLISGATMGASSSILYIRDLVHGLLSGHEPGVGLMSSVLHDIANVGRDVFRGREALNRQHAAKTLGDALTLAGESTGMSPKIVGNTVRYGTSVYLNQEKPRSIADVLLGVTKGTQKRRTEK